MGSNESLQQKFEQVREQYRELVTLGEQFIEEQIYRGWKVGQYVELVDEIRYVIYRNFPDLYERYFQTEPQLPVVSKWYYFLSRSFWLPEKWINGIFWPKYGPETVQYIEFYNCVLEEVISEMEQRIGNDGE